jgi:ABC-2 type transport system ATP-binding protein
MHDEGAAIATQALTKRYRDATALDRVELSVPEGAVYVLVGTNGAGKSTTLKVLMNLERPDAGAATVFGMDTGALGPQVRAQIGYVPERHDPGQRWMRCDRLLQHVAAYYPSWDRAYADQLTRALELRSSARVGSLSKGEARRLQLVMALAHRPPLLLLDEPTDGLDPIIRRRALALLAEHLADTPTTVLISTHQVYEVESLADHVGVLRAGRLVAQMSRDELLRTVRRYRVEAPEDWAPPSTLRITSERRSRAGREVQWTVVGEERVVAEQLSRAGAHLREVSSVSLEDAALAFLEEAVP